MSEIYASYQKWGSGYRLLNFGPTEESLGKVGINNWVVNNLSPGRLSERINQTELKALIENSKGVKHLNKEVV